MRRIMPLAALVGSLSAPWLTIAQPIVHLPLDWPELTNNIGSGTFPVDVILPEHAMSDTHEFRDITGAEDRALMMHYQSDLISIADCFNPGSDFTLAFWMFTKIQYESMWISFAKQWGHYGLEFDFLSKSLRIGDGQTWLGSIPIPWHQPLKWYHVAIVKRATLYQVYRNGRLIAEDRVFPTAGLDEQWSLELLSSLVWDDVMLWNEALSQEHVAALVAAKLWPLADAGQVFLHPRQTISSQVLLVFSDLTPGNVYACDQSGDLEQWEPSPFVNFGSPFTADRESMSFQVPKTSGSNLHFRLRTSDYLFPLDY